MSMMSPSLLALASQGEHRRSAECEPKPYKAADVPAFKAHMIHNLGHSWVMNFTTVSPAGWPVGSPCRYVFTVDAADRPTLYTFVRRGGREHANILGNPRVSYSVFHAVSFERRRETRAVQTQALAEVVSEPDTWLTQARSLAEKGGWEPSQTPTPKTHVLLRIETLHAVYNQGSSRPLWGSLDYLEDLRDSAR
jgi:hypothetical protein